MEQLSNMARMYRAQALAAIEAFNNHNFAESDRICLELLQEPHLPLLWRAKANFMLGTSDSNTSIEYASDAVRVYEQLLQNNPDSDELKQSLKQAQKSLDERPDRKEDADTAAATETPAETETQSRESDPDTPEGVQEQDKELEDGTESPGQSCQSMREHLIDIMRSWLQLTVFEDALANSP